MKYAKVVFGLPIEGPFDYLIPEGLSEGLKLGMRVGVSFHHKNLIGYVVGFSSKTNIKNVKTVLRNVDASPLLNENALRLTKEVSQYYCCSWGEAIEAYLPQGLKND